MKKIERRRQKKKRAREKIAKQRVLARRKLIREKAALQKETELLQKQAQPKLKPLRKIALTKGSDEV